MQGGEEGGGPALKGGQGGGWPVANAWRSGQFGTKRGSSRKLLLGPFVGQSCTSDCCCEGMMHFVVSAGRWAPFRGWPLAPTQGLGPM